MGHIIQTNQLTRRFGELTAVDELTLSVQEGEIFGFLGHNGAGKTTTIRLLNGVLSPSSGTAHVLGLDPAEDGASIRKRTGVLTENPANDERLTARENLKFYADLYNIPEEQVESRLDELFEVFELQDRADERVGGYSKGMKQRLALARALLHQPEILFLDEPTSGLDPVATRRVHNLITQLRSEGRTIFLCTHNLIEAQRLCDRVAVLEHGRLLALGTPAELGRRLGRRQILEIEVDLAQMTEAADLLKSMNGVSVSEEGGLLTVTGLAHPDIPEMLAALVNRQIAVYRITPQDPSLEDIYFALHGEEEE